MAFDGPHIRIWTDGSVYPNPGPGGWAAVMYMNEERGKIIWGSSPRATNQMMELRAVASALQTLKRAYKVTVYSDSAYVINCMKQGWWRKWKRNGWRNAKGDPVSNRNYWELLITNDAYHQIEWVHIKGHSGAAVNELAHDVAGFARVFAMGKAEEEPNEQGETFTGDEQAREGGIQAQA